MAKAIDAKYLEGLVFTSADTQTIKKDGRDVRKNIPTERPLTPDDVLDWKDLGDKVVIVAADGQKHTVSKNKPAPAGDEKDKKDAKDKK